MGVQGVNDKRNAGVSPAGPGASRSGRAAGRRLSSRRDGGAPQATEVRHA
jgi:hypothetical protein